MASITFNDGISATLQSAWPSPADRFRSWEPFARPIGEGAHGLGDGVRYQWRFRTDYGASFEVVGLTQAEMPVALRLQEHLLGGGTCTVTTDDASSNTYGTCGLAPETEPELSMENRTPVEWALKLTLIDVSGSPVAMVCEY